MYDMTSDSLVQLLGVRLDGLSCLCCRCFSALICNQVITIIKLVICCKVRPLPLRHPHPELSDYLYYYYHLILLLSLFYCLHHKGEELVDLVIVIIRARRIEGARGFWLIYNPPPLTTSPNQPYNPLIICTICAIESLIAAHLHRRSSPISYYKCLHYFVTQWLALRWITFWWCDWPQVDNSFCGGHSYECCMNDDFCGCSWNYKCSSKILEGRFVYWAWILVLRFAVPGTEQIVLRIITCVIEWAALFDSHRTPATFVHPCELWQAEYSVLALLWFPGESAHPHPHDATVICVNEKECECCGKVGVLFIYSSGDERVALIGVCHSYRIVMIALPQGVGGTPPISSSSTWL